MENFGKIGKKWKLKFKNGKKWKFQLEKNGNLTI